MAERRGINNTHLKSRNRGLTLQLIAAGQPLSRADITRRIGLTKMTVTNIVAELIADGFVEEKSLAPSSSVGRHAVLLDIAAHAPKAVGVYLSREEVTVILTDLKLQVLFSHSLPLLEETPETLGRKLLTLVYEALHQTNDPVLGIGVASIGPLDKKERLLLNPTNFFGIRQFPIAALLEEGFHLPVSLQNDMNAAALAEKLYGLGRPLDTFLYLGIANGIGSGIISGGRLYRDSNGFSGEIGHTCLNFDGPLCSCGNRGCLETYISMPVILDRLREASGQNVFPDDFEQLMETPACDAVFRDVTEKLAIALTGAVNLLDPQCVIIGHEGAMLPELYIRLLEDQLNRRILAAGHEHVLVSKSIFGSRAPLLGSVCGLYDDLFSGRN